MGYVPCWPRITPAFAKIITNFQFRALRVCRKNLPGGRQDSYKECGFLAKNKIPVTAVFIDSHEHGHRRWPKKRHHEHGHDVGQNYVSSPRMIPDISPICSDSNWGKGDAKNCRKLRPRPGSTNQMNWETRTYQIGLCSVH